jgi:hypothetical protein
VFFFLAELVIENVPIKDLGESFPCVININQACLLIWAKKGLYLTT